MKEFIKKYWWVIIVCILFFIAAWFIKPDKTVLAPQDQILIHKIDSIKYVKKTDSLSQIIDTLKSELKKKKIEYITVIKNQSSELEKIKHLSSTEIIKEYSNRVDDSCKTVSINGDTSVITSMNGIKTAVVLLVRGEQCLERESVSIEQTTLREALINSQDEQIKIKNGRIKTLTNEFYSSQAVISRLNSDIEKEKKRNRIKNIIIGSVAGVAAVGILVAVLK